MNRLLFAAALALLSTIADAAISVNTVFEIRTTGADTNGGGFVAGASGTDWSQQDAAQYSVTDGVTAGTTTVTSVTANFGTDVIGNIMYIQGGTGSVVAGWYQITARASATSITVDRSTGLTAGTGVTLKIGGALASPGMWNGTYSAVGGFGCDAYIKAGTYDCSTTNNVSGGRFTITGASTNVGKLEGYQTTRGDLGTKPVIRPTSNNTTLCSSGGNSLIINIEFDANAKTGCTGIGGSSGHRYERCKATGVFTTGFSNSNTSIGLYNWASGCVTGFSLASTEIGSLAVSCTTAGFSAGAGTQCISCIDNGSAVGFTGSGTFYKCTAFGGSSHGFSVSAAGNTNSYYNCVAYGRGGKGFSVAFQGVELINCAAGGNTSSNEDVLTDGTAFKTGFVTLSADPFVASGSGNFGLNSTTGGGASLRGAGFPTFFPAGLTPTAPNIGATENSTAASGGGAFTYSN